MWSVGDDVVVVFLLRTRAERKPVKFGKERKNKKRMKSYEIKQIEANVWIINSMDSSWVITGESSYFSANGWIETCDDIVYFNLHLWRLSPLCDNQIWPSRKFKIDRKNFGRHSFDSHDDIEWIFSSRFNPKAHRMPMYSNIHRGNNKFEMTSTTMHRPRDHW